MRNIVPKIAAIQDLSGYGRCSLTVILPILACMGMQVCPVPTAVLSTHTGGFDTPVFEDLTGMLDSYIEHWKKLGLEFDCIYSGFLGNEEQIDKVLGFFSHFKKDKDTLIVVDPVMGDHGELYKTYNEIMQEKMKILVGQADVITPNWTEACFLLGKPYHLEGHSKEEIKEILRILGEMGPKVVVITGVVTDENKKVNVAYDKIRDIYWMVPFEEIPVSYPGTGDTFTSVLVGGLLKGDSLPIAISRATQFVEIAVRTTYGYGCDTREGILLEKVLTHLTTAFVPTDYFRLV